jgi:molecular chaperone IbpA
MWTMNTLDFSPLFRSSIGFDRLMRLADASARGDVSYPPYNIEKTGEDSYRLSMAVAGFGTDDLEIRVQENALYVTGEAAADDDGARYLHRGIARRAFERRFQLADTIKVTGARLDNGLLHVELVREVPEALKPRTIQINAGPAQVKTIDQTPVDKAA